MQMTQSISPELAGIPRHKILTPLFVPGLFCCCLHEAHKAIWRKDGLALGAAVLADIWTEFKGDRGRGWPLRRAAAIPAPLVTIASLGGDGLASGTRSWMPWIMEALAANALTDG
jgi:hypothetical protein